jgi:hypothetical protein
MRENPRYPGESLNDRLQAAGRDQERFRRAGGNKQRLTSDKSGESCVQWNLFKSFNLAEAVMRGIRIGISCLSLVTLNKSRRLPLKSG